MGRIIEIKKNSEGMLDVDLIDILNVIEPEGAALIWTLFDLEATGDLGDGNNILDLEQEVRESPTGLCLNWNDLVSLARRLFQVINAILAGSGAPIAAADLSDVYAHTEIVLEAIDSSLWRVYAQSDAIIEKLKKTFNADEVTTA
jgi:hypothetical protein